MFGRVLSQPCNQAVCSFQRNIQPTSRKGPVIMAGLKKETKKLAKTLKAHRKRLESLLAVQQTSAVPVGAVVPQLSQAELHAVLCEVAQLQTALAAVRQQKRQLAAAQAMCDSSDSSDSECDEEPKRRRAATVLQPVQQMQGLTQLQPGASQSCQPQAVVAVAATLGSNMASTCLEAPPVDQDQPDLCQQLPAPQQYTATGCVLVCQGKACVRKGALQVLQAVSHATSASPGVEVLPCKCLGKCKQGPALRVRTDKQPRSSLLTEIEPLEVPEVLDQLLA